MAKVNEVYSIKVNLIVVSKIKKTNKKKLIRTYN
jgi:hypothetical protein